MGKKNRKNPMEMKSGLLKRSGVAVVKVAYLLGWEPDCIIQVGVGIHHRESEVLAQQWPKARMVGFEPHPDIARSQAEQYPGAICGVALGNESGTRYLYYRHGHKDGASLYRLPEDQDQSAVKVRVERMDTIYPKPSEVGDHVLLWLDCEGSELEVLKGGERFVEHVEMINIELTGAPQNPEWGDPVDIHFWLLEHDFKRQTTHTTRSRQGQYDAIYVKPHLFKPELCCCPCMIRSH